VKVADSSSLGARRWPLKAKELCPIESSSQHAQSFIEPWSERVAAVRQVFIQPDARLFTRPVGCARFSQRTDERFHVVIRPPEPFDRFGKRPACGGIPVQK
jgi:hypothetical protein